MGLKIRVDTTICAGHALCAAREPLVYALDPDGYCSSDGAMVPPGLEEQAQRGARLCPEGAITLWQEEESSGA